MISAFGVEHSISKSLPSALRKPFGATRFALHGTPAQAEYVLDRVGANGAGKIAAKHLARAKKLTPQAMSSKPGSDHARTLALASRESGERSISEGKNFRSRRSQWR